MKISVARKVMRIVSKVIHELPLHREISNAAHKFLKAQKQLDRVRVAKRKEQKVMSCVNYELIHIGVDIDVLMIRF